MSKENYYSNDEAFNIMYKKFYENNIGALFINLKPGTNIYPDLQTIETTINNCLKEKCTFRFLYNPSKGLIEPLKNGDEKFPFTFAIDNKKFFHLYVH